MGGGSIGLNGFQLSRNLKRGKTSTHAFVGFPNEPNEPYGSCNHGPVLQQEGLQFCGILSDSSFDVALLQNSFLSLEQL